WATEWGSTSMGTAPLGSASAVTGATQTADCPARAVDKLGLAGCDDGPVAGLATHARPGCNRCAHQCFGRRQLSSPTTGPLAIGAVTAGDLDSYRRLFGAGRL